MTGAAVAALPLDLLQYGGCTGQRQSRAAVFFRDQRGQVAALGERSDELGRIAPCLVQLTPVLAQEAATQLGDLLAYAGISLFRIRMG